MPLLQVLMPVLLPPLTINQVMVLFIQQHTTKLLLPTSIKNKRAQKRTKTLECLILTINLLRKQHVDDPNTTTHYQ